MSGVVHAVRLMGDPMKWTVVCTETLPKKNQKTVGSAYTEKITCKKCLEICEARLEIIKKEYMPRIMKIPWVGEAIEDGVFKDES